MPNVAATIRTEERFVPRESALRSFFIEASSLVRTEKIPMIAKNSEWERILKEQKEQQQQDILAQVELNKTTKPDDTIQTEKVE